MLHRVRELLVRQRTMLTNAFRGHLAELGIIAAQGQSGLKDLVTHFHGEQSSLPELARVAFRRLIGQIGEVVDEIGKSEKEIVAWCRTDAANMISAAVPDPTLFQSGRQFAAWLGLTPKPRSRPGRR
jgi:transposase